ncbi:MAG: hypothetical protein Q8S11_15260 [Daejeonella sp.]|uniref:hypothetical protein n=1 Tax=Daejeonella sp. TaxID=2805397 RepID=UPI00273774D2|nr:hypothetical protein [Daejeonella sp.]MDP3469698.1 hypothetical protein [Daejeonella sp.]
MNIKSFSPGILFLFAVFLLHSNSAIAQQRRLINYTEISALIHGSTSLTGNPTFNGFRTRTGVTKLLNENFGIGFALGTDNYRKSGGGNYNTLPITLNASYYIDPQLNGLKLDAYGGYAVKLFNNLNRGLTAGAGISYSIPVNPGLNLGLQTGYNYQKIDFPTNFQVSENFDIGSIRLGLGLTFK